MKRWWHKNFIQYSIIIGFEMFPAKSNLQEFFNTLLFLITVNEKNVLLANSMIRIAA